LGLNQLKVSWMLFANRFIYHISYKTTTNIFYLFVFGDCFILFLFTVENSSTFHSHIQHLWICKQLLRNY